MSIFFCIDFGNTRKKIAIFNNKKIILTKILEGNYVADLTTLIYNYKPTHSILSSVIQSDIEIEKLLNNHTVFFLLNVELKLPFKIGIIKKETIGVDRIALVSATQNFKKLNQNFLIISLGSCITYNFLNSQNLFLGGSISPGMRMRLKAMHQFTNALPLISNIESYPLVGYDTKTNLLSGVLLGIEKELDGVIDEYKKRYNNLKCVLTGGDTIFFANRLKNKIFVDDFLLFKGLYELINLQIS